jgi:Sjoegren syndrome nuclear autoantigen 1
VSAFDVWLCGSAHVSQEEEKNKIQNDLRILTERLSRINESLARKVRASSLASRSMVGAEVAAGQTRAR